MTISGVSAEAETLSIVFAASLVWLSALVQHLSNVGLRGAGYVMSDRSVAPDMTGFFGRATRTLANNIESAVMYIPAALAIIILGKAATSSHVIALTYMAARSIFAVTYWLKVPVIRSFAWLTGMICCAVLYEIALV